MPPSSGPAGDPRQRASTDVADAMLGIALAALWADGRERPAEVGALSQELDRLEAFDGLSPDHVTALAADLREGYAADGVDAYLGDRVAVLDEAQARQALTLAIDVVLADREVTEEELAFIDDLRARLGVPEEDVDRIVEVLETKHGLELAATTGPPTDEDEERFIVTSEASVAFAVGAARAATPGTTGADTLDLAPLRARRDISERTLSALVDRVNQRLDDGDVDAYLAACARRLEGDDRERAFAWASDVALADRRLSIPEHGYLTEIRSLLGIEPSRASRIVDVLWVKHLR